MNMVPKKVAFVVMPFGTKETGSLMGSQAPVKVDFDALWNGAYHPALERAGYLPIRADIQEGSLIIKDMIEQLMLADLVLADISLPNANVYYETGLRHGGSKQGCLLFSASWAKPVFDLAQIRCSKYTLDTESPTAVDYRRLQHEIFRSVDALDASSNPVRELIDTDLLEQGESRHLKEVRDAVIQFQKELRACRLQADAQKAKQAALKILAKHSTENLPSYSIRELFELVRDVLGWGHLLDFYSMLNEESAKLPFFKEQIALAKSKTVDTAQAIADVESLIKEHGHTSERSRLLGMFYKQRFFESGDRRKKALALKASIRHYETGQRLDLNDYGCSRNLLVLYPLLDQCGEADKASRAASHVLQVCEHKRFLNAKDKWINISLLLVAFHDADIDKARSFVDDVAMQQLANWERAQCIEFLELLVKQIPQEKQENFHSLIDDFKFDISIDQSYLVQCLSKLVLETGRDYKKFKAVKARAAEEGEKIVSVVEAGRETVNFAEAGDYVVENQTEAKELYIVSGPTFEKRYEEDERIDEKWRIYVPLGRVKGIEVERSILNTFQQQGSFYITAPWGEAQHVDEGDMFVTTLPLQDKMEIYRIARKEFSETYVLV